MNLDVDRALQKATLEVDEKFATRWVETMRNLVAEELDHADFIERKMTALKQWNRDRKREQHNLGYKFDPSRRRPHLVARDVAKQLADARRKVDDYLERKAVPPLVHIEPDGEVQGDLETPRTSIPGGAIAGLDPLVARAIAIDMDLDDLTGITAQTIIAHYINEEGMTEIDATRWFADLVRHAHGN